MNDIKLCDTPEWKKCEAKVLKHMDDEFDEELAELEEEKEVYSRLVLEYSNKKKNGRQCAVLKAFRQSIEDKTDHFYDRCVIRTNDPDLLFRRTWVMYESIKINEARINEEKMNKASC